MPKVLGCALLAALALALPAAAARATTYCVHQGGSCPAGQSDSGANLQAALSAASTSSGNTVLIGAGTFTSVTPFTYLSTTHPVTITGAGVGATHLQITGATADVLDVEAPSPTRVSGLTLDVTANVASGEALITAGASASSGPAVDAIAATNTGAGPFTSYGAALGTGTTLTHGAFDGGLLVTGTVAMSDVSTVSTGWGIIDDGTLTATRLTIVSHGGGIDAEGNAHATVDGLLMRGTGGSDNIAAYAQNSASLTIRSATFAVESGTWQEAASRGTTGTSDLTIVDSIFTGFTQGTSCSVTGSGVANLTFGNDDRHAFGAEGCVGPGTFTPGTGNIDVDPLFVNPAGGDYRLRYGSPAIDAGGASCATPCQGSDLDGLTRPIDGNGDGSAVRDMGAYEYGHRAPSVAATGTATGLVGSFTAAATDPDDGDALSYAWTFDDGAHASGAAVAHAFSTPGQHTATVTVTDPSGLQATGALAVTLTAPPAVPAVPDRTPPGVGAVHLSHHTFRRGTRAARAAKRSPTGTTISFALSENATVRLTFAKRVKRRYSTVRGRTVTLSLKAGKPKIVFQGIADHHHRLATGSYRLTLVATDAAGNRSAPRTATFTIARR